MKVESSQCVMGLSCLSIKNKCSGKFYKVNNIDFSIEMNLLLSRFAMLHWNVLERGLV